MTQTEETFTLDRVCEILADIHGVTDVELVTEFSDLVAIEVLSKMGIPNAKEIVQEASRTHFTPQDILNLALFAFVLNPTKVSSPSGSLILSIHVDGLGNDEPLAVILQKKMFGVLRETFGVEKAVELMATIQILPGDHAAPKSTIRYAHKRNGRFDDIYGSPIGLESCGKGEIYKVRVTQDPTGEYWAWWDNEEQKFVYVHRTKIFIDACFPYNLETYIKAGKGTLLKVHVEEIELVSE